MKPPSTVTTDIDIPAGNVFIHLASTKQPRSRSSLFIFHVLCSLTVGIFLSTPLLGTTLVGVWTPSKIVIGADSKVTGSGRADVGKECKIRTIGRFTISLSGFIRYSQKFYDAWMIVAQATKNSSSVGAAAADIQKAMSPILRTAVDAFKREYPAEYAKAFPAGIFLSFIVAGVDSGKPILAVREYHQGGIQAFDYPLPGPIFPSDIGVNVLGAQTAINMKFPTTQSLRPVLKRGPVEFARTLIQIEIENEPITVGPPRAIIEITPQGIRWVEPGICVIQKTGQ